MGHLLAAPLHPMLYGAGAVQPNHRAYIASKGFGLDFTHTLENPLARYDMRFIHVALFAGQNGYQYSQKETLLGVRAYAQFEPKNIQG